MAWFDNAEGANVGAITPRRWPEAQCRTVAADATVVQRLIHPPGSWRALEALSPSLPCHRRNPDVIQSPSGKQADPGSLTSVVRASALLSSGSMRREKKKKIIYGFWVGRGNPLGEWGGCHEFRHLPPRPRHRSHIKLKRAINVVSEEIPTDLTLASPSRDRWLCRIRPRPVNAN